MMLSARGGALLGGRGLQRLARERLGSYLREHPGEGDAACDQPAVDAGELAQRRIPDGAPTVDCHGISLVALTKSPVTGS